jgi:adenylate kinase family enzyme
MHRISIVGNTSSGKTTLAAQLAEALALTHIELDELYHQANWVPTPPEEFKAKIRAAMAEANEATGGWTMCGNYRTAGDGINQAEADTIIWLDMQRWLVMSRVIRRTVRRAVTRQELWNGNRESRTDMFRWDPTKNLIRWAWVYYDHNRQRNLGFIAAGDWAHATVHHLRSPAEVEQFLATASANRR